MANLKNIFITGVNILFDTFEESVHRGTYTQVTDNGFDDILKETEAIRCIFEKFTEEDFKSSVFSELIQPTDIKGLVPAEDVTLNINTKGYCTFDAVEYTIEGYDIDPMGIIYTLLLRNT